MDEKEKELLEAMEQEQAEVELPKARIAYVMAIVAILCGGNGIGIVAAGLLWKKTQNLPGAIALAVAFTAAALAIVAVVVLVMCNRTNWAGYVLYQAMLAVFGLAMPVLYFTGLAHSLVGAVVPSILAVATLAGMAVFGDRTIKNEFRRRLHF